MKKPRVVQFHHLVYSSPEHHEQEWTEKIYKSEHLLATRMNWYCKKSVSRGFLRWLRFFILKNEDRAIDLAAVKEEEGA